MPQTIESIVDGIIQEMTIHGIKEITLKNYYNRLFMPIIHYCHQNGDGHYSSHLTKDYLDQRTKQLESGSITDHYYRSIKRMVKLTDAYALTGKVDFSKPGKKIYNPSFEHMQLLETILSGNPTVKVPEPAQAIMRHFFCFLESSSLEVQDISDKIFLDFMTSVSTVNRTNHRNLRLALKLISDHIRSEQIADVRMDFSMLRLKQSPVKAIEPYSPKEIQMMFNSIEKESSSGARDFAILMLAFSTGLRAADIIRLQLTDIDWKAAQLNICQQKTHKPLILPLSNPVMNAIAEYILNNRPACSAGEVFLTSRTPYRPFKRSSSLDAIIQKYSEKAGVKKKPWRSFHSLRRSFATELSAAEVPLTTISQMLGHKNIDSDKPYLSYNRSQILFCAIGFGEIPIVGGLYSEDHLPTSYSKKSQEVPMYEF